jgi:hypothetical protein
MNPNFRNLSKFSASATIPASGLPVVGGFLSTVPLLGNATLGLNVQGDQVGGKQGLNFGLTISTPWPGGPKN